MDMDMEENVDPNWIFDAIGYHDFSSLKEIVEKYPSLLELRNYQGKTPLHFSAELEDQEIFEYLVQRSDLDVIDDFNNTPLLSAAYNNKWNYVYTLLKYGADPEIIGDGGLILLNYAANYGDLQLVKYLVNSENINHMSDDGGTALIDAISSGNSEIFQIFIRFPTIDLNFVTDSGETPLILAFRRNKLDFVEQLLFRGADPTLGHPDFIFRSEMIEFSREILAKKIYLLFKFMLAKNVEAGKIGYIPALEIIHNIYPVSDKIFTEKEIFSLWDFAFNKKIISFKNILKRSDRYTNKKESDYH